MEDILLKDGVLEALEYINNNGFSEVISTKENVKLSSKDLAELMDLGIIEVRMNNNVVVFNLSDEGRKVLRSLKRS
uniref:Transcriptional regulator n=1 Tax=Methanococcus maripaludis (strain C6 / ATCC BAA-1332) TaxID=444158 RepID=A9ABA2_METM6